ncbi:MAG: PilZ domain-containing protein [Lachnospiraceae bacterium]
MQEKRKSRRMELESQIILKRLDSSDGKNEAVDITMKDVSKSGVGFTCKYDLSVGAVYECQLTLWTKEVIHSFIEIVRVMPQQDGETSYGGIFIGMSEMDLKRIEIYFTLCDNNLM